MSKNSLFGLSLSDRLAQSNLSNTFSQAVNSGNNAKMSQLLRQIDYPDNAAKATVDTFLRNPRLFKG